VILSAIKEGKAEQAALAAAGGSKFAKGPEQNTRILEDPVSIPTSGSPVTGPANAPITLIEFSDFQCPYCIKAVPQIQSILKAYPTEVKLIFKEFPLEIHSEAAFAASAALAAHKQGKFWAMHDALFANRNDLSREIILALAKGIGLDMNRFETDLASPAIRQAVLKDIQDGDQAGVEGTPTLFINGQRYNGPIVVEALKPILDSELKKSAITARAGLEPRRGRTTGSGGPSEPNHN
jgi:protein-disulfide isomerase